MGGWTFRVVAPTIDERVRDGETPLETVLRLAVEKVKTVAERLRQMNSLTAEVIITADTAVVVHGSILGKPTNAEEAVSMLRLLRGCTHQVYSGVAVYHPSQDLLLTDVCCTEVTMRSYTEEEIVQYVASGDPFDKAGGYAIQHPGFRPVKRLNGCYANVVGLPICHLTRMLNTVGIPPKSDVPNACQSSLGYKCPIYQEILHR